MANIARIELGDTTYEDDSIRSAVEAITDYDAEDNIYVKTSQLEVNGDTTTDGTIISKSSQIAQTSLIDRDGTIPSSTVWGPVQGFRDKDNENIGYLQIYQSNGSTGSIGLSLQTYNEDTDGNQVGNYLRLSVGKDGTCYYNMSNPTAFRTAIDAQVAGNYVTRSGVSNAWLTSYAGANQQWGIGATVTNTNNSTYNGHSTSIIVHNATIGLYDSTDNAFRWYAYTTLNKPTPADIGAQAAGSYATTNASGAINTLASTSTQQWCVKGTVSNSSNKARNGHTTWLVMTNTGLNNWDGTSAANIWDAYTTAHPQPASAWSTTKSTTVSSVITAASGITIDSVTYAEWGKLAMLSVTCKGFANSTGSKSVGTVLSGKRPVHNVYATDVSSSYAAYAQLTTGGALTVYWSTAPATATSYTIRFIYLLA